MKFHDQSGFHKLKRKQEKQKSFKFVMKTEIERHKSKIIKTI